MNALSDVLVALERLSLDTMQGSGWRPFGRLPLARASVCMMSCAPCSAGPVLDAASPPILVLLCQLCTAFNPGVKAGRLYIGCLRSNAAMDGCEISVQPNVQV